MRMRDTYYLAGADARGMHTPMLALVVADRAEPEVLSQ